MWPHLTMSFKVSGRREFVGGSRERERPRMISSTSRNVIPSSRLILELSKTGARPRFVLMKSAVPCIKDVMHCSSGFASKKKEEERRVILLAGNGPRVL